MKHHCMADLQCDQIWRNFATLAKFSKSLAMFEDFSILDKMFNILCQLVYAIWPNFIVADGQIFENNLAIWSHFCPPVELVWIQPDK